MEQVQQLQEYLVHPQQVRLFVGYFQQFEYRLFQLSL